MAISIFPSTAAEFVSNNFVVDMNDTSNNTAELTLAKEAGPYRMVFSSGDETFDVYLVDATGSTVGYSNTNIISASATFDTVVILGVASSEIVTFNYVGSITNADGEGDVPGAGAYLESITPSDLPEIDDTATVVGGNFGADTEITFESGTTVLSAKSITVISGTEAVVTRPDGLIQDLAPYDVRAITTGVAQPTGTNSNLLSGVVTAGENPTWVTTSPLNLAPPNAAFSQTLEATDSDATVADYQVVAGTLTTGLTLDQSTGVLSGTATEENTFTFTVRATDTGGNTTDREFSQTVAVATGGTITTDAIYTYHTFKSSDTFATSQTFDVDYLVVAGGGAGGGTNGPGAGGGGAGGLLQGTASALPSGFYTVSVGSAGNGLSGARGGNGSDSTFSNFATSIGGGGGGGFGADPNDTNAEVNGAAGGSGGGGSGTTSFFNAGGNGGAGTAGQGFNGGKHMSFNNTNTGAGGGGGGSTSVGVTANDVNTVQAGGSGTTLSDWATASSIGNGEFAAGGAGASETATGTQAGATGTGHGGIGATQGAGTSGKDGSVILRFVTV